MFAKTLVPLGSTTVKTIDKKQNKNKTQQHNIGLGLQDNNKKKSQFRSIMYREILSSEPQLGLRHSS